jgi:hypothetical protein
VPQGRLITASCTTGWFDWIHGELWLFPDGLLRASTGLATTISNGIVQTVSGEPRSQEFVDGEIERIVARGGTNLWIQADQIRGADIHVGLMTSRMKVHMADGHRIKLLWLRGDRAERPLTKALSSWGVATGP